MRGAFNSNDDDDVICEEISSGFIFGNVDN